MSTTVERGVELRLTRLIKAAPERVFAAWITPEDIQKWFGPEECRVVSARIHPRVGGEYQFRMTTENYGEISLHGIYRDLKPSERLSFTWNFSGHPKLEFGESLVKVEFSERNGFTEVQITHEGLHSQGVKQDHIEGWNGSLDKLEKHLGSGAETAQSPLPVGEFSWNELLTSDEAAARKFYSAVFGWRTGDFPGAGMQYTLWKQQGRDVGGLMKSPREDIPPQWLGYVTVADADATVRKITQAGGRVLKEPFDVPTVGRIAVFQDPQGAALGVFQPQKRATTCGANQIVWCDVPVKDLDRATRFYSAVLGAPVTKQQYEGMSFALLPHVENSVSGCLAPASADNSPSQQGPMIYLNCQGRLEQAIAAVVPNGGKVLQPLHQIGPHGFRAVVLDSEGNRIGLHSM